MYDHATFSGVLIHINDSNIVFNQQKSIEDPNTYVQFLLNGTGVIGSIGQYQKYPYYV